MTVFPIIAIAVVSSAAGVYLTSLHSLSRRIVPFSGGVLMGIALFWVLPQVAGLLHWNAAIAWTLAGFALLAAIDRFIYPVCPACSHEHGHQHCATRLHGFAPPLLIAATLHSLLDGWGVAGSGGALALGIGLHKIPEGLALGVIARAALKSRMSALILCALAESATFAGGTFESITATHFGAQVADAALSIAAGSFIYLGGHAIHGELRRSGRAPAFVPALTGVAGSSVLKLFVH